MYLQALTCANREVNAYLMAVITLNNVAVFAQRSGGLTGECYTGAGISVKLKHLKELIGFRQVIYCHGV